MNKKQADNFATLYHFLKDQVPDENFDLGVIANCDSAQDLQEHRCGSAACVCGWMPTVFPRTFTLVRDELFGDWSIKSRYGDGRSDSFICQFAVFFGITREEASDIVVPDYAEGNDDSRKGVLKRMRALALKYGWEI